MALVVTGVLSTPSKSPDHSDTNCSVSIINKLGHVEVYKGPGVEYLVSLWVSPSGCWALTFQARESFKKLCPLVRGLNAPCEAPILGLIGRIMDMVAMVLHLHPHLHLGRSRKGALFDCKTAGVRSLDIRHHPTDVRTEMDVDSFIRRTLSLAATTKSHFDETARTMTGMVAKTLAHRQRHLVVTEPFMTCPTHDRRGLGTILETPTTKLTTVTNMLTIQPSPEHSRTPNAPALQGSTSQDPHASSRI